MDITFEKIKKKLGFDPLNPPDRNDDKNPLMVDDHTPSPYSVLSDEESHWLCNYMCKKVLNRSFT